MANRAKTLVKKARELEVLCDVPVCFNPDGEFYSWPDNQQKLQSVLKRYQEAVSSPATRPSKKGSIHVARATGYCNGDELLRCIESRLEQLNQRITDLQQEGGLGFEWVEAELEQRGLGLGFEWVPMQEAESEQGFEWVPEAELGLVPYEAELDLELGGVWYDMDQNKMIIY